MTKSNLFRIYVCNQVNLRVTASPTVRNLQTRVRVRVDTNEKVLGRSPENETRTIVVTNR